MDRSPLYALILAAIPIIASRQDGQYDLSKSALLVAMILIGAAALHIFNIYRVHKRIECLMGENCSVSKETLYREMTIAQGSNFWAMSFAAWLMLFVAISYLYFLVPTIMPLSYMQVADLASASYGFTTLGLTVALGFGLLMLLLDKLPDSLRYLKPIELYSFYIISKNTKRMIVLTIITLSISIVCSAYIGTIYPGKDPVAEGLALITLAISAGALVSPVYREAVEGLR